MHKLYAFLSQNSRTLYTAESQRLCVVDILKPFSVFIVLCFCWVLHFKCELNSTNISCLSCLSLGCAENVLCSSHSSQGRIQRHNADYLAEALKNITNATVIPFYVSYLCL